MKKITFLLIALLVTVVTFAALPGKQSKAPFKLLKKSEMVKKQTPAPKVKAIDRKALPKRNGVRKAEAELVTPPETVTAETFYTVDGSFYVSDESGWIDATDFMSSVNVAIDGTDMYIQGLAYWFPEGWIKGTIDGTTVTFASGQFIGEDDYGPEYIVGSMDGKTVSDIIFNYDSEEGVLTATTYFILESGEADAISPYTYWQQPEFSTTEPVLPDVVEAPAELVAEEYVMTYTDSDGNPATASVNVGFDGNDVYFQGLNSYLPEAWVKGTLENGVVTLPGGQFFGLYYDAYKMFFMDEDYQFAYDAESEKFVGEGVLYCYTGNQYTNYYENPVLSKDTDTPAGGEATFDFNKMDVATSNHTGSTDGDITEDITITESGVALTITPKAEGATTENRFWATKSGPQLRVYSGTLTFEASEGLSITQIVFNYSKWNDGNTADGGTIGNDAETSVATWTGDAQKVVVSIAGNSQINSIVVTVAIPEAPKEEILSDLGHLIAVAEMICSESMTETLADAKAAYENEEATAAELSAALEALSAATLPELTAFLEQTKDYVNIFDKNAAQSLAVYFQSVEEAIAAKDYAELHSSVLALIEKCKPVLAIAITNVEKYAAEINSETLDTDLAAIKTAFAAENYSELYKALRQYEKNFTSVATTYLGQVKRMETTGKVGVEALNAAIAALENKLAETNPNIMEVGFAVCNLVKAVKAFLEANPGTELPEPIESIIFDFEDGTFQGWTTIDADGDGLTWKLGASPSINTVNESSYSVYSESYNSNAGGALLPDNFLVSPKMKLDGSISFYACAQDGDWAAEHFAVAVSSAGNTDAADFTNVEEWTMTASRVDNPMNVRGTFRSPKKTPGNWYKYTVDLSSFEGAEGYAAIRHFDCTDNFYIVVDDIEIVTSKFIKPDFEIIPAEGKVESLSDFTITFNNYDIVVTEGSVLLTNETTSESQSTTEINVVNNTLTFAFAETTAPGEYTLSVEGVKTADGEPVELTFNYTIEAAPEVVVLPEGLEAETWYFSANGYENSPRFQEVAVAIDGSDIYIQGLNVDYLPEAWVKGTIDAESGTATFATGQYFGAFNYEGVDYDMFFVGYDEDAEDLSDVVFAYDAEAGTLTTDNWIVISSAKDEASFFEYYRNVNIVREKPETPDLVELPEGVETEEWTIEGVFIDGDGGKTKVTRVTEVAFDGNDIYVKGIPLYFEDAWMKGTINTETGIATFASGQFVGEDEYGWEFMLGSEDYETLCDIQFAYDTNNKTLTQITNYIIENAESATKISPYGYYADMVIYFGRPITDTLETETYLFTANAIVNGEEEEEGESEPQPYKFQMEVGFNGNDVYFKGVSDDTADMWIKGTLSEDGKTVTIPANQYLGSTSYWFWSFDYYFTAVGEDGETLEDIVLNYDAENNKFTTNQVLVLHDGEEELGEPYQTFYDVIITKILDFATTPADPAVVNFTQTAYGYWYADFDIPALSIDGDDLLTSKLYYTVWIEKDNIEQPLELTAELYNDDFEENMLEIPYNHDGSDVWKAGERVYLNQEETEIQSWTKIGVQSIYYGGDEANYSNIVWNDGSVTYGVTTGITNVKTENGKAAVIFDLQGRRVAQPAKGLYIKDGKKVVLK